MEPIPSAAPPRRKRPLVMIAEDMGIQVRLTQLHLERAGCDVTAAPDGVQALERIFAEPPDLILLDVEMPELNGFQVLDRLRSNEATRHIPVIMLTAHAKDAPLFAEWAQSADAFMTKPFTPDALVAEVKRILAQTGQWPTKPPAPTDQTDAVSG